MYQREALACIRAVEGPPTLTVLSDQILTALWGLYSRTTRGEFWLPCDAAEVWRFLSWAQSNATFLRAFDKAKHDEAQRAEIRAESRHARPPLHFVLGIEDARSGREASRSCVRQRRDAHKQSHEQLMTVHELVESVNHWCAINAVMPSEVGVKPLVDEQMVRYCCEYSLLDRPGSPEDGRRRGFSEKHACQLRVVRLLQARSMTLANINSVIFGRSLSQLRGFEREEITLHKAMLTQNAEDLPSINLSRSMWWA